MDHDKVIAKLILTFNENWFRLRKQEYEKHPSYNASRELLVETHKRWVHFDDDDTGYEYSDEYTYDLNDFYWHPCVWKDPGIHDYSIELESKLQVNSAFTIFYQIDTIISSGLIKAIKDGAILKNFIFDRIEKIRKLKDPGFKHLFQKERNHLIERGILHLENRFKNELRFSSPASSIFKETLSFNKSQTTIIRLFLMLEKAGYFKDDFTRVKHYSASRFTTPDADSVDQFINFEKFRDEIYKMKRDKDHARYFEKIISDLKSSIQKLK